MFGHKQIVLYTLVFFVGLYVVGYIFPEPFWSIHFAYFNSFYVPLFTVGVSGILLFKIWKGRADRSFNLGIHLDFKTTILVTLGFAFLFYFFPIQGDFYGDAYKFNSYLNDVPTAIPRGTHQKFFNLKLAPWTGEGTILALITYLAYGFQITYYQAFVVFDAFWGGLFVFCWLYFVQKLRVDNICRLLLILAGVTAPFMLVFYGHIEIYAPIFFSILLWSVLAIGYIKTKKTLLLVLLCILFLVNIKLHLISVLLFPSLLILWWEKIQKTYPNWKQVTRYIFVPVVVAGMVLYFLVFQDHVDPRSLQRTVMEFDHLFLPLFSPNAPLDKYNLLSFNHILDFVFLGFLWSPIALFTLVFLGLGFRKKIHWNAPEVIVSGTNLLLFVVFLFMINPLLSMPIDWDLFSIPAPLLLVFTAILVAQARDSLSSKGMVYAMMILVLLSIPIFITHQSEKHMSRRLESIAKHIYKTYYEWTAQTVRNAYSFESLASHTRSTRGEIFLKELKPFAEKGRDYSYSYLLTDQALFYLRDQNKPLKALAYFEAAQTYFYTLNVEQLKVEALLQSQQFEAAFRTAQKLVKEAYPSLQKSLRIGIHTALEALKLKEAQEYSKLYLEKWPDSPVIKEVNRRLEVHDNVREIKFLFEHKNNE